MPTNIELKARIRDMRHLRRLAEAMASAPAELIEQVDTFFRVPQGRLKLRQTGPERGELIYYERPDDVAAKPSTYTRAATLQPEELLQALTLALGVRGVVRKQRRLYLVGQTRIHLDTVEGLGEFVELECVLRPGQPPEEGDQIIAELRDCLGILDEDLVAQAYIDLGQVRVTRALGGRTP
jgi:predicted adenylyl cyclase CyaB